MIEMDRVETCNYIKELMKEKKVKISRYVDGEYLLMSGSGNLGYSPEDKILKDRLITSIKNKNQLVCTNTPEKNKVREINSIWDKTYKFLVGISQHEIYGNANWAAHSFNKDQDFLAKFFQGNVLIVSGITGVAQQGFKRKNFIYINTPLRNSGLVYDKILNEIIGKMNEVKIDNIILSCGPTSKVLLSDLTDKIENCNIIDLGATLRAILSSIKPSLCLGFDWPMSWAKAPIILELSKSFLKKINLT